MKNRWTYSATLAARAWAKSLARPIKYMCSRFLIQDEVAKKQGTCEVFFYGWGVVAMKPHLFLAAVCRASILGASSAHPSIECGSFCAQPGLQRGWEQCFWLLSIKLGSLFLLHLLCASQYFLFSSFKI